MNWRYFSSSSNARNDNKSRQASLRKLWMEVEPVVVSVQLHHQQEQLQSQLKKVCISYAILLIVFITITNTYHNLLVHMNQH